MAAKYAIYILRDGEQLGPFTKAELGRQLACGVIGREEYAWYEGLPDWILVHEILTPTKPDASQDLGWRQQPATASQLVYLRHLNFTNIPPELTSGEASDLIERRMEHEDDVTDAQKRRLYFYKIDIPDGLSKFEASILIDAYITEHPESEAAYQKWKAVVVGEEKSSAPADFLIWAAKQSTNIKFEFGDRLPGEPSATPQQLNCIRSLAKISESVLEDLGIYQASELIEKIELAKQRFADEKVKEYFSVHPDAVEPSLSGHSPVLRIASEGEDLGAIPIFSVKRMLQTGKLTPRDYYFDAGTNDWMPLDCCPELKSEMPLF